MAAEKDNTARAHVLHVDDDPDIRLLISASLREFGYVVATAGTNAEALELAKQFRFDLCILDVRLPDGSGIELCQEIHQLQHAAARFLGFAADRSTREQIARLEVTATDGVMRELL